jgi:hypothetical protein
MKNYTKKTTNHKNYHSMSVRFQEFNYNQEEEAALYQTTDEPFQRQTAQRFSHISTIQKVNLCFWFICWSFPQLVVGIILSVIFISHCMEQSIWVLIYVSITLFEPCIFAIFYFLPYKTTSRISRVLGTFACFFKIGILAWGIVWTVYYANLRCVHMVNLEIAYLIIGFIGVSFICCNCLILCLRETDFLGSSNFSSTMEVIPEWK